MTVEPFVPPPYPHDRLKPIIESARAAHGEVIDLSIGTPCDPPPSAVLDALYSGDAAKSYPPSVGTVAFREAASGWFARRLGAKVPVEQIGACVGTKELVAGVPHWLRLRQPDRDTVLYPAISYPTYAMGAQLAGCRAVAVPLDQRGGLDLEAIDAGDADRALCLWSNSPSNPTGALDDLGAVAKWGRSHGVPVFSDECYIDFTWSDRLGGSNGASGESVLNHGTDGVVALNSLSKRSNLAGLRVGFYAGDAEIVHFLNEVRKHSGLMVPGPAQLAGIVALEDQSHVEMQRERYLKRMRRLAAVLSDRGLEANLPEGGFYLWIDCGERDGWSVTDELARELGVIVSPGDFYGHSVANFVRVAAVQPDDLIDEIERRQRGVSG
ncbi:MAG: aminotransferase class I/II-fold pyridoxal phosphate-dependent enzyme [Microthrixaceae bacterium]